MVRTGLASQQERLRELGVPAISLVPSPPELTEAARSMAGGPAAVLAALRAARGRAEAADAALAARGAGSGRGRWPARVAQPPGVRAVGAAGAADPGRGVWRRRGSGRPRVAALICGLPMPAVAFVAGWIGHRPVVPGQPRRAAGPYGAFRRAGVPGAGGAGHGRPAAGPARWLTRRPVGRNNAGRAGNATAGRPGWVSAGRGASGCQRGMISAIASARDLESVCRMPRTAEVMVLAPDFWMPRIAMHMCSHSSTTTTPRGASLLISRSATCEVSRSCTWGDGRRPRPVGPAWTGR